MRYAVSPPSASGSPPRSRTLTHPSQRRTRSGVARALASIAVLEPDDIVEVRSRDGRGSGSSASRASRGLPLRTPFGMLLDELGRTAQILRRVHGEPHAFVAMRMEPPFLRELRERRLLVVALLREERERVLA